MMVAENAKRHKSENLAVSTVFWLAKNAKIAYDIEIECKAQQ